MVEHYRVIKTYRATGSTPYSPALAARTFSSSPSSQKGTYLLDDCMEGPPLLRLTGNSRGEGSSRATISWLVSRISGPVAHRVLGHRGAACLVQGQDAMHASTGTPMAAAGWLAGHPSILPGTGWVSWARDITACLLQSLRPDPTPMQQRGGRGPLPTAQYGLQAAPTSKTSLPRSPSFRLGG